MTAAMLFANNASSRLYAAIDAMTTSIRVETGDGSKFPQPAVGDYFMVTIEDRRTSQIEICKCVGRSGDILNVTRAQESTPAQAFLLGATVSNRLTAQALNTLVNAAGVTEAPIDTFQYGRQDAAWTRVTWTTVTNKPATFPPTLPIQTSDVTGLDAKQAAQDAAISQAVTDSNAGLALKEDKAKKGVASGYAPLDATSKVPAAYLPAYVDDVLEFANLAAFPQPGTAGIIYVALDTNKTYRWGGSSYTEISPSPGTTDQVPEGTTNLYFTNARASAAAPVQSVAGRTGAVTLTKTDVGLANVDNTSDINKPVSTAQAAADALKANINNPTLTGDPKAPTPPPGDNDTSIATTAFVNSTVNALYIPPPATISDGPPVGAKVGELWFESDSGETYIWYNDGTSSQWVQINSGLSSGGGSSGSPSGATGWFASTTAPVGWLKANGAAVSRTLYNRLFTAIGTAFGVGDGTTTFNLPDLRGEFVRAWDDSRGIDVGRTFGSAQLDGIETHTHTWSGTSGNESADHVHGVNGNTGYISVDHSHAQGGGFNSSDRSAAHTHGFTMYSNSNAANVPRAEGTTVQATGNTGGESVGHVHATTISGQTGGVSANHYHAISFNTGGRSVVHTHTTSGTTAANAAAISETRPRNVALLACIKY